MIATALSGLLPVVGFVLLATEASSTVIAGNMAALAAVGRHVCYFHTKFARNAVLRS
jgi:hypothetical protein